MNEDLYYALLEAVTLAYSNENYRTLTQAQRAALEVLQELVSEHTDEFNL